MPLQQNSAALEISVNDLKVTMYNLYFLKKLALKTIISFHNL